MSDSQPKPDKVAPRVRWLSGPVLLLGAISLVTDLASEAIYPLLPVFLTTVVGAGALSIGIIEGAAEAATSLLKVVSGRLSDRWQRRRPLIAAGYALSSLVRPLIAVAGSWVHVFGIRLVDRLGKGTRGAPRDAMLSVLAPPEARGRVFGFHRAMDHAGAIAGPVLATMWLWLRPEDYRGLFAATLVPGLLVVALLFRLPADSPTQGEIAASEKSALGTRWRDLPPSSYKLLLIILLFSLGNSTDAFLLLRLTELGVSPVFLPLAWAGLHVVKSVTSVAGGWLADHAGRRVSIATGWAIYAAIYGGFAVAGSAGLALALFFLYGLYFGLTEGPEKALITDLTPGHLRGAAFGLYHGIVGIGSLGASLLFGLVWELVGPAAAFSMGAGLAIAAALMLGLVRSGPEKT